MTTLGDVRHEPPVDKATYSVYIFTLVNGKIYMLKVDLKRTSLHFHRWWRILHPLQSKTAKLF
jgi:hypothetical protein